MLAATPGVGEGVLAAQAAAAAGKSAVGEQNYSIARSVGTWGWSAANGFLPINIVMLPFQIAMMVVFTIMFLFVFGVSWKSVLAAYILQGILSMMAFHWMFDAFLTHGVGI